MSSVSPDLFTFFNTKIEAVSILIEQEQPDFREARDAQFYNKSTGASNPSWIPQHALRNISEAYGSTRPQVILSFYLTLKVEQMFILC